MFVVLQSMNINFIKIWELFQHAKKPGPFSGYNCSQSSQRSFHWNLVTRVFVELKGASWWNFVENEKIGKLNFFKKNYDGLLYLTTKAEVRRTSGARLYC